MNEKYSFKEAVLLVKRDLAFDAGDMAYYDKLGAQLIDLEQAHEKAKAAQSIAFLKHVSGMLIAHFVELEVPKVKLLSKTVNIVSLPTTNDEKPKAEPDSISTIATGWILRLTESEFGKSDSVEPVFSGYLINKSRDVFMFKDSQLTVEKGKTSYTVSKYSEEYLSMTKSKDLHEPYLDVDEAVIGEINLMDYRNASQRQGIESILAYAAINEGMEKKIIST